MGVHDIRDQCLAAGVPFFFKQFGEWDDAVRHRVNDRGPICFLAATGEQLSYGHRGDDPTVVTMARVGKHAAGRLLDGREHSEFPSVAGVGV